MLIAVTTRISDALFAAFAAVLKATIARMAGLSGDAAAAGAGRAATAAGGPGSLPPGARGSEPDGALLSRVARGDQSAMADLYDRYARSVLGMLVPVVGGDRGVAEEIMQEAFVRVWKGAAAYRPELGSVSGWLFAIARNAGLDARRRRGSRPLGPEALPPESVRAVEIDPDADVSETAWERIRHARVRSALDVLPDEQRAVVTLAYFDGLTRKEIAETTGMPLGTVHTRARLGLEKLRSALSDELPAGAMV